MIENIAYLGSMNLWNNFMLLFVMITLYGGMLVGLGLVLFVVIWGDPSWGASMQADSVIRTRNLFELTNMLNPLMNKDMTSSRNLSVNQVTQEPHSSMISSCTEKYYMRQYHYNLLLNSVKGNSSKHSTRKNIYFRRIYDITLNRWYTDLSVSSLCIFYRQFKQKLHFEFFSLCIILERESH